MSNILYLLVYIKYIMEWNNVKFLNWDKGRNSKNYYSIFLEVHNCYRYADLRIVKCSPV